jgi:hypothetical protein
MEGIRHAKAPRTQRPYIRSLKPPAISVTRTFKPGTSGSKSLILWRRYNGALNPAAHALGPVGTLTLAAVREKARHWSN